MNWRKEASLSGPFSREPAEVRSRKEICPGSKASVLSTSSNKTKEIHYEASGNDLLTADWPMVQSPERTGQI